MDITVYNKKTGKILRTLTGRPWIKTCVGEGEDYIEGKHSLDGKIINNKFVKKKPPFPEYPAKKISDTFKYASEGHLAVIKALQNTGLTDQEAQGYVSNNYRVFRVNAYPTYEEFIDAQVKIESGDKDLKLKGKKQKEAYVKKCLDVKTSFKRPVIKQNVDSIK